MIQLSGSAADEIRRLKSKQLKANVFFRLAIKAGGCSGWFYEMLFDETLGENDIAFESSGIKIVIDAQSLDFVNGLGIDYSQDLMGGGFRFHNQKAIAICGCGNSFSLATAPPAILTTPQE